MNEKTVGRYNMFRDCYHIPCLKVQSNVREDLEFEFSEYYKYLLYKILNNEARFST